MREIKFAWVCRNKHFNEIERVELTDTMLLDGSRPSWITSGNCEIIAKILPVGALDKNGKEIYEGDIVRFTWLIDQIYVVKWNYETHEWKLHNREMRKYIEIIGNIYENPELLEGET